MNEFHVHIHSGDTSPAGDVTAQKIGDGQLLKSVLEILIQLGIIKLPLPATGAGQVSATP